MLRVERSARWKQTERDLHLDVPALLLWGAEDRLVPVSMAELFATRLPRSRLHVLPGAGRVLHDERPAETYALLTPFLAVDALGWWSVHALADTVSVSIPSAAVTSWASAGQSAGTGAPLLPASAAG
jgi:hypothetical protein